MAITDWFTAARFGLVIHWGAYAVRGFEASWPLVRGEISYEEYEALADQFAPRQYDPVAWAALAKSAGIRYAVLTTKHHDGFAIWDTKLSDYSAVQRGPKRDLIRPYVEAFRAAGLKVGFYFSLCDWHHPDYPVAIADARLGRTRPRRALPPDAPESIAAAPARWERYLEFMHGQVRELCTMFGKIDLLWFDGQWEHTAEEWRSRELVAMIRELQPGIVINDRLADRTLGDYATPEQFVPVTPPERPWETCMTINETWAYNPNDRAYKSSGALIATLAEVVSKGGNFLLNVGPTADGEIPPVFAARLAVIGQWLARNGEAIYGAGPGLPPGAYFGPTTAKGDALFLHVLGRPSEGVVRVRGLPRDVVAVRVLATGQALDFDPHRDHLSNHIDIHVPDAVLDPYCTVLHLKVG